MKQTLLFTIILLLGCTSNKTEALKHHFTEEEKAEIEYFVQVLKRNELKIDSIKETTNQSYNYPYDLFATIQYPEWIALPYYGKSDGQSAFIFSLLEPEIIIDIDLNYVCDNIYFAFGNGHIFKVNILFPTCRN